MLPLAVLIGETPNTVADLGLPFPLPSPAVTAVIVAGALFVGAAAVVVVPGDGTRYAQFEVQLESHTSFHHDPISLQTFMKSSLKVSLNWRLMPQ